VTPDSPLRFGRGGLAEFAGSFEYPGGRAFLVTSEEVARVHGAAIRGAIGSRLLAEIRIDDREEKKTLAAVASILDRAVEAGLRRDDFVVAFGGGVVSDVAGFAAAVLLRGIQWYAVPTTLLAMADASIGGKTAVDHPAGKNLIGAFHSPSGVLIDPDLLDTLPDRQFRSGLVEIYKALLVGDAKGAEAFLGGLEAAARSRDADAPLLAAIRVKEAIVGRDPLERGERRVLNFGHTLGHAIEAFGGYRRFTHGEAVAVGMAVAGVLSAERAGLDAALASEIRRELAAFAKDAVEGADPASPAILRALDLDKKASSRGRAAVLLKAPGKPVLVEDLGPESWLEGLRRVRDGIVL
jgi:3-dehydroquinate synthetase